MRTPILSALSLLSTLVSPSVADAQAPPGYVVVQGAFINGSGIGTARSGMSVASCAAACSAEPRCLSFEMYGGETCGLNVTNRASRPNILTRSDRYTYYERVGRSAARRDPAQGSGRAGRSGVTRPRTGDEQLFIYENCARGPTRCTLGVAAGGYAYPGNARWREGWRGVMGEGPFSSHPAAWRRVCSLHNPPSRVAPDITSGEINCGELGVTARGGGRGSGSGSASARRPPRGGGGLSGYVVVEGAFINGRGIGRARPGHTPSPARRSATPSRAAARSSSTMARSVG